MNLINKRRKYYFFSFLKYDLKASITVFFVALPLCLSISVASEAPIYTGLISGIIGGIIVSLISKSQLSVSGPAAGLTSICAVAIAQIGSVEVFFFSVAIAGLLQILLGVFRLGGFTHFIPSSVIKGMLAAIGIMIIFKQIPFFLGYDKADFWSNSLFNVITFNHAFEHLGNLFKNISPGTIIVALLSLLMLVGWKRTFAKKYPFLPTSFIIVIAGTLLALFFQRYVPSLQLKSNHFVSVPNDIFSKLKFPDFTMIPNLGKFWLIWKNGVIICFVASLETLLSIAAIDKIDPYNRVTPQNRELIAQGVGNFFSGLLNGLPITAVIVRSSANAEANAKTKFSSITHGVWLLISVLCAIPLINKIPFCVLAVILIRTGYNLAKPKMIYAVYKQGKEQFWPFIFTVVAILFTDLLIGVLIGIVYAIYFLIKHSSRAGFTVTEKTERHTQRFTITLDLNASFLIKKRLIEILDKIPRYSIVEVIGSNSNYIDRDVLEIFQEYKSKAHRRHIQFELHGIKEVEIIGGH